MNKCNKVKKSIDKNIENKIINWNIVLYDSITWLQIEDIKIKTSKFKLKLSNNKQFMKKFTDRKLNIEITKELREVDLWFLYKILNYIDEENIIDFKKLKIDYSFTDSKLSKSKRPLFEKLIIKEDDNWFIYLNPLVWIKAVEINQELINLFKDSFEKYWVDINYK